MMVTASKHLCRSYQPQVWKVASPDKTSIVVRPPCCPNRMSVSRRSPTMQIWFRRSPNVSAMLASMNSAGLPTTVGSLFVEPANTRTTSFPCLLKAVPQLLQCGYYTAKHVSSLPSRHLQESMHGLTAQNPPGFEAAERDAYPTMTWSCSLSGQSPLLCLETPCIVFTHAACRLTGQYPETYP